MNASNYVPIARVEGLNSIDELRSIFVLHYIPNEIQKLSRN